MSVALAKPLQPNMWVEPVQVQLGDIWQLGKHRLMCGDSTSADNVARLMQGERAKLLLTDPPYNLDIQYQGQDDNKDTATYEIFCKAWFTLWQSVSQLQIVTPGCYNLGNWLYWFKPYHCAPWIKTNVMKRGYVSAFFCWEPILFYGSKWKRKRGQDIFNFPISRQKDTGNHPCPKPLRLWLDLMENYTDKDELVTDAFCGSGTSIIAGENLQRCVYAMEIEPSYCDLAIQRWQEMTGQKAVQS